MPDWLLVSFNSDNGEYWIGYDDVDSFALKAKFINFLDIAGGMVWSIDTDDFHGDFHDKPFPMLHVRTILLHKFCLNGRIIKF